MPQTTGWVVSPVKRPDAAFLYNAIRYVDGRWVEASITPTHSQDLARKLADSLNASLIKE